MDAVDQSEHYEVTTAEETPSLLSIIIDTNPRAWAALSSNLSLSAALANLLVFANAHLAFSNANQISVIAAHVDRAVWLYPSPDTEAQRQRATRPDGDAAAGVASAGSANKYPQFAHIESTVLASMRKLLADTNASDLETPTTKLSGALTLALCHINKATQSLSNASAASSLPAAASTAKSSTRPPLKGRILVVSVSDAEPTQYIPTMNAVFAASHAQVAIDTLSLSGDQTFLQQASFHTNGTFLSAAAHPQGFLTYLMFGLVADTEARESLVSPAADTVDFRAACFCHGRVVDQGFVCSICLSIFCELPDDAECLTCGTKLALGNYGAKPAVVPRKKKKKKRIVNGGGREETGSATGTPRPG